MVKLEKPFGDRYADFELLISVEKTFYVLDSELWEKYFKSLLSLVYCKTSGWKEKLYGDDSCPNQLQSNSSTGNTCTTLSP